MDFHIYLRLTTERLGRSTSASKARGYPPCGKIAFNFQHYPPEKRDRGRGCDVSVGATTCGLPRRSAWQRHCLPAIPSSSQPIVDTNSRRRLNTRARPRVHSHRLSSFYLLLADTDHTSRWLELDVNHAPARHNGQSIRILVSHLLLACSRLLCPLLSVNK